MAAYRCGVAEGWIAEWLRGVGNGPAGRLRWPLGAWLFRFSFNFFSTFFLLHRTFTWNVFIVISVLI